MRKDSIYIWLFGTCHWIQDVKMESVDMQNREQVVSLLESMRPDAVISCIGLAFEEEVNRMHYLGNVNLVDAAVA